MRPISEWTRDDLEKLIADDIRESLNLDFKSSPSLGKESKHRNELSKDISAFANSAGGTIIYGIVEKDQKPDRIDDGSDDAVISREWLEQTLGTLIQPRIQGLVIRQIPLGEGRSAYAVSIPQATSLAPHQANDNKYYRRFNFASVPMEDYEVRDTMRRATTPELYVEYVFSDFELTIEGLMTRMIVVIGNRSQEPAHYSAVDIAIDRRANCVSIGEDKWTRTDTSFAFDDGQMSVAEWHRKLMIPGTLPIFRERAFRIGEFEITIDRNGGGYFIGQDVSCPGFHSNKAGVLTAFAGKPTFSELTDHTQVGRSARASR
ncbi:AlbA family DNA-binding domain-containing protein [Brevundimonas aurifodinae]|uniref:ATP-binding protein n=1 Tax=Brevundimonas aurifodinae TaxID=1508312 RepID=A0ABV1NJR5_9CAUL